MHVVYNIRVYWYLVVKGKNREHSVIAVAHYTAYRIISDRRIVWELLVAIGPILLWKIIAHSFMNHIAIHQNYVSIKSQ